MRAEASRKYYTGPIWDRKTNKYIKSGMEAKEAYWQTCLIA